MKETWFVTGCVGVVVGTPFADEVKKAFQAASAKGSASIYVLGSLFAPGASKDACISYLEALPGSKVLVTAPGWADPAETECGAWQNVKEDVGLKLWGNLFRLAPDPQRHVPSEDGLLLHVGRRVDTGSSIRVLWTDWTDRFGPGGLCGMYSLWVLAQQIAAGMVAPEPEDAR